MLQFLTSAHRLLVSFRKSLVKESDYMANRRMKCLIKI
ncbi:hypothetical protein ACUXGM_005513 [Cytobacillus horneckiae]